MPACELATQFAEAGWPTTLRTQQVGALDALARHWGIGHRRGLVVLPPGAGKMLVGLDLPGSGDLRARRRG